MNEGIPIKQIAGRIYFLHRLKEELQKRKQKKKDTIITLQQIKGALIELYRLLGVTIKDVEAWEK